MTKQLVALYEATSDEVRSAGRTWYADAFETCRRLAGDRLPVEAVVRAMAALSPRSMWSGNVSITTRMVRARLANGAVPSVSTRANRTKAWRELGGEPALSGPKTTAFAAAILGDPEAVVIDAWILRAVGLNPVAKVTAYRQRWIGDAIREAAAIVGETPRDFQAIVWCAVRGRTT